MSYSELMQEAQSLKVEPLNVLKAKFLKYLDDDRWGFVESDRAPLRMRWLELMCDIMPRRVFIDIGSGYGNVLLWAHLSGRFSRVIGVESNPKFYKFSRANLPGHIEIYNGDVREFKFPQMPSIIYTFGGLHSDGKSYNLDPLTLLKTLNVPSYSWVFDAVNFSAHRTETFLAERCWGAGA